MTQLLGYTVDEGSIYYFHQGLVFSKSLNKHKINRVLFLENGFDLNNVTIYVTKEYSSSDNLYLC